ncbi:hypothetical protein EYC80_009465 [Monilinia laxa]|uniref:Uncharacterized protein n=1 Tax=Monilinia laxa TaxID=61186 RepID=A0A5N6JXX5_MONLA|nr:hypothetical protein EYC80_009465 [Monilinia laxa]
MKGLQMQKLPTKPPFRYRSRKLRSFGAWDARNTPRLRSDIAASKIVEKKNYKIVAKETQFKEIIGKRL